MNTISMPKISVVVITYNQQNLISRAIDSLLIQKDWIYEIIVCDDCSTDSTWNVVLDYATLYPSLIKPYRNECNLGIFGNIENTWSKPTGDLVTYLSGDDECCDHYFSLLCNFISNNAINYKNEAVALFFDHKVICADDSCNIVHNQMLLGENNILSLKIRRLVSSRGCIYSVSILSYFKPIPKGLGLYSDFLQDIQLYMYVQKWYYVPAIGAIYYKGIGIASHTLKVEHYKSLYYVLSEFETWTNAMNKLTRKDKQYLSFRKYKCLYKLSPSISFFCKMIYNALLCIKIEYGWLGLKKMI